MRWSKSAGPRQGSRAVKENCPGTMRGHAPQELGCPPSCTHSSTLSSSASTSGRYRHQRTAWASAALSPLADRDHKPLRWLRRAWSPGFSVELADAGLAPAGMPDPLRTGTFPGLRLTWRFLVCPVPARPRDGVRLCRNCVASSRAVTCSRCGVVREAATRDERGQPLCPYCMICDPANLETCAGCDRRRIVSVRAPGGPLCPACRPAKTMICSICARVGPAEISKITGEPRSTALFGLAAELPAALPARLLGIHISVAVA